jgi:hypothetical protein
MSIKELAVLSLLLLAGCGTVPERRLEPVERVLKTDGTTTMLFHSSLYYPTELSLRFDGYLIGIEKSPRDVISSPCEVNVMPILAAKLTEEAAKKKIVDSKLLYISHIIENKSERGGIDNCTIYNAYNQVGHSSIKQLTPPCSEALSAPIPVKSAFKNSWRALDQLESAMRQRMRQRIANGKYTDIVVITMGWNTVQEEAIRNFNSIVTNLKASAGPNFNPLVLGVTWPSQWESDWFNPIYKFFSFPVKSADADELGLTWLGVLLHKTIPGIQSNLPVTVIGHSFGSRASSVAACIGPAIYENSGKAELAKIDNLVNLQGAFLSSRLFGEKDQKDRGMYYPNGCKNVTNIVLTSSVHDTAMNSAIWGIYAGDERSYKRHCTQDASINCVHADAQGNICYITKQPTSNITYVNANELIRENAYLSGGGAHSDIYRKEHGVLINKLIPGLGAK